MSRFIAAEVQLLPPHDKSLIKLACARSYGCTKWAVEILLRELHQTYAVPVSIFRCGMILSHTRYLGMLKFCSHALHETCSGTMHLSFDALFQ